MKLQDIYSAFSELNSFLVNIDGCMKECIIIDCYQTAKGYFAVQDVVTSEIHMNVNQKSIKAVRGFNSQVSWYFQKYDSVLKEHLKPNR